MKKLLKIFLVSLLVLLLTIIALLLTIPLWLGPVVKPVANNMVPKYTLSDFNLGHIYLNPYSGRFELGSLKVANPSGYSEKTALSLSNLAVEVSVPTILSDCIRIKEVTVENLFVSYVQGGGNNVDNFTQIQYNIAGGKDKYEQKKALEMKEAEEGAQEETSTVEEEKKPAKKIVVEKLTVSGIKLKYGAIVIPLPTLTLRNLGEESGGVSIEQFLSIIGNEILSSAMKLGKGLNQLFEMSAIKTTEVINDIGDGAAEASSQVSSAVTNAVSNIGEKSKDVVLGVAEGTKSAASAVGSGAVKAVESVGEGALKAVESVGDGTKKAASAIKNIFKK
ncbi:MAG: AsmA family protein [Kiritimatiellae bacterium]|nr:AsmA family protein [Kiritimatiellia bacterium]